MHGDHACAEGAIAAGCTFFAGYPITPSTEIAERLAQRLPEVSGVFIQMEDELASMAAILGASAAGKRSMTATSGPGMSLMMENIGLGVMLEIPCVVVNVQRGGPSTGLPTAAGQSDIMQARWGSHGDYSVVAYSPWSPQEIFDLTVLAFNVADRFRVPVLMMADEVVGHMVERVVIPAESNIPHWKRKTLTKSPNGKYLPFRPTGKDGVPPMPHAGEGYRVHFESLTHNERGFSDLTADTHHKLVSRLIDKINRNSEKIIRVEGYDLDDAKIVVVSFGCTARSAKRAVQDARAKGIPVGLMRLISIWPFPEEQIRDLAKQADTFIVAEMNLGQVSREIERLAKQPVHGVFHAGGAMIAPKTIFAKIEEVVQSGGR